MAGKKKEEETVTNGDAMQLPEGFKQVNTERAAAYYRPYAGSIVQGIMLGRFKRKDADSGDNEYFYQIRLTKPYAKAEEPGSTKDNRKFIDLEPGQILQIDERAALQDLEPYAEKEELYEVFIATGEKQSIKGGKRTFWPMKIGARPADEKTLEVAGMNAPE